MKFHYLRLLLLPILLLFVLILSGCGDIFGGEQEYKYSKYYLYKMNPDGSEQEKISKLESDPESIAVSADEKFMAVSEQSNIAIIDLETGDTLKEIEAEITGNSLNISSNSKFIVFATISSINYYDIYSGELVELWDNYLGDYPIFIDSTKILYSTFSPSAQVTHFRELDLLTGLNEIIFSCATYSIIDSYNIQDNDLYFMFQGDEEYNTFKVLRHVNLETGHSYAFNSVIGRDHFDISPTGNLLVGNSSDYQARLRIFSSDGMDYFDTFEGENPIFVDNENILFMNDGEIYYGKLDGSSSNKIIDNGAMYYSDSQDKVYYIKEKKVYE